MDYKKFRKLVSDKLNGCMMPSVKAVNSRFTNGGGIQHVDDNDNDCLIDVVSFWISRQCDYEFLSTFAISLQGQA